MEETPINYKLAEYIAEYYRIKNCIHPDDPDYKKPTIASYHKANYPVYKPTLTEKFHQLKDAFVW